MLSRAHDGRFALLLAYTTAMPLVAGAFGRWFFFDLAGLFERSWVWAVPLFAMAGLLWYVGKAMWRAFMAHERHARF